MISSGSCFPNCKIFFHDQPFKTHPLLPYPTQLPLSSSFLGFCFLLCLTIVGMPTQTQTQFHVLAVDDSLIDRKLIERLLKTSSYQVTAVDSGSKALEFLGLNHNNDDNEEEDGDSDDQQVGVNLIITDYCMPGMTGYDLLRKIKQSSSFKHIPVVIMSSENIPSRINRCLEEGAQEFFLKPVQLSDVNKLRPHLIKGIKKRKGVEDIHSPDRTRARYNELELV